MCYIVCLKCAEGNLCAIVCVQNVLKATNVLKCVFIMCKRQVMCYIVCLEYTEGD